MAFREVFLCATIKRKMLAGDARQMRDENNPYAIKRKRLFPLENIPEEVLIPRPGVPVKRSLTAEEQRKVDEVAVSRFHIPLSVLMEYAGLSVANYCETIAASKNTPIHIFVGKGNNGGDGYVCARLLFSRGYAVCVWTCFLEKKSDARLLRTVRDSVKALGILVRPAALFDPLSFSGGVLRALDARSGGVPCVIIDGILGSGFSAQRELSKEVRAVTEKIQLCRQKGARVLSIDVPSGVDATTGEAARGAVQADATMTFLLPKEGLLKGEGKALSGQLRVDTIGLPPNFADVALDTIF